jgi:hypothetical protein
MGANDGAFGRASSLSFHGAFLHAAAVAAVCASLAGGCPQLPGGASYECLVVGGEGLFAEFGGGASHGRFPDSVFFLGGMAPTADQPTTYG